MTKATNLPIVLTVLAGLLLAGPVVAEGSVACQPSDTISSCWELIAPEPLAEALRKKSAEIEEQEGRDLQELPTGLDTGGLNLATNTKDFLPRLLLSGLLGDPIEDETSGNLIFDLNFLIPGEAEDNNAQLQLAITTDPELSGVVKEAIPEEGRADVIEKLEAGLGDLDEFTLSFTYNWTGGKFGRTPSKYRDQYGALLQGVERRLQAAGARSFDFLQPVDHMIKPLEEAIEQIDEDLADEVFTDIDQVSFEALRTLWKPVLRFQLHNALESIETGPLGDEVSLQILRQRKDEELEDARNDDSISARRLAELEAEAEGFKEDLSELIDELEIPPFLTLLPLPELPEALAERKMSSLIQAVEHEARQAAAQVKTHQQAINDAGLDLFANLVNNQPQLHFTVSQRVREAEILGGDETSFKITYEWGRENFTSAMSEPCFESLGARSPAADVLESCLAEYSDFVSENRASLKAGHRFSFAAKYVEIDEALASLPGQGIDELMIEGAEKLVVSVGWGRLFGSKDKTPIRLDLKADYEDVSDDPMRQDRGIASITVTRSFGDITIPFGIVYANHAEFLTDVDEELSSHFGIKFRLGKDED